MLTKGQIDEIGAMLGANRGKIGSVEFTKKNGEIRKMNFRQSVKNGSTPLKGGKWANNNAGAAYNHGLVLVTDIDKDRKGEHSRRSFSIDSVIRLKIGGEVFELGENCVN